MKKFNTNIKRRYLKDQTVTQKPIDGETSYELGRAFIQAYTDGRQILPRYYVKKGDTEY